MIGQLSGYAFYFHIIHAVGAENGLRRLRTGESAAIVYRAVLPESVGNLKLGPKGQKQDGNQQHRIEIVGKKRTVAGVIDVGHKRVTLFRN